MLEEHFEELQMLWELWQIALEDPDYRADDLAELEERIEAHVDGVILGDKDALPILAAGLGGDEPAVVFAAAYVLLRRKDQASADHVMDVAVPE